MLVNLEVEFWYVCEIPCELEIQICSMVPCKTVTSIGLSDLNFDGESVMYLLTLKSAKVNVDELVKVNVYEVVMVMVRDDASVVVSKIASEETRELVKMNADVSVTMVLLVFLKNKKGLKINLL